MNTSGKIVLGFFVGTALGAVTALLLAPATGLRSRKNLNKKAKKFVKQIKGLMGEKKRKVTRATSQMANGKAPVTAR